MKSPNLNLFTNSREFVTRFLVENKEINPKFTQKYFAKKLRWPGSYLSDVIHGRKPLTLSRAMQLATFMNFDDTETEQLLFMVISERTGLTPTPQAPEIPESLYVSPRIEQLGKIHDNLGAMAVLTEISAAGKRLSPVEICNRLYTFPEITPAKVKDYLNEFEKKGICVFDAGGALKKPILEAELLHDRAGETELDQDQIRLLHEAYGKNFIRYLKWSQHPRTNNAGFLVIDLKYYQEVQTRFFRLRNWLVKTSAKAEKTSKGSIKLAFQYDLNFFPISKHDLNLEQVRKIIAPGKK